MGKNNIINILFILTIVLTTACESVTQVSPINTKEVIFSTAIPDITTPAQTFPAGQYGVVKLSLEIMRDGKFYEVLLGYDLGRAWWNQDAQIPDIPQAYDNKPNVNDVTTQWVGDVDGDGNLEYIVELLFCGAYCSSEVQIIHYDPLKDEYRVFDSFGGYYIKGYRDDDKDGNPEIVSQDYDYHFKVGGAGATRALAPIKIYQYNNQKQKFVAITSQYPDLVIKDAANFLEDAKSNDNTNFLKLAAYLYDMYVLGKQEEGTKTFNDVCEQYIKPTMENPDWTCEKYFQQVQITLSEMKIGSE